jgi:hypothetical protein
MLIERIWADNEGRNFHRSAELAGLPEPRTGTQLEHQADLQHP